MTTLHPVPVQLLLRRTDRDQGAWCSTPGVQHLFFKPLADGIARHTEGALQTAQGTAFFISAKDLFPLRFRVTIGLRVVATAALTVFAPKSLFTIAGVTVSHQLFTIAVTTFEGDDNHALRVSIIPPDLSTTTNPTTSFETLKCKSFNYLQI